MKRDSSRSSSWVVGCDFDGTAAANDVGNRLFETFAAPEWREVVDRWKKGDISSKECLERECAVTRVEKQDLDAFIDEQELRPGFYDFAEWCRKAGLPLFIVSDGMEYYIRRILKNNGLSRIPVYSNSVEIEDGTLVPGFPHHDKGCGRCGNCKCAQVDAYRADGARLVYIGDGYSDTCVAVKADLLYARADLARFCGREGIPFRGFVDFVDLSENLEDELKQYLSSENLLTFR